MFHRYYWIITVINNTEQPATPRQGWRFQGRFRCWSPRWTKITWVAWVVTKLLKGNAWLNLHFNFFNFPGHLKTEIRPPFQWEVRGIFVPSKGFSRGATGVDRPVTHGMSLQGFLSKLLLLSQEDSVEYPWRPMEIFDYLLNVIGKNKTYFPKWWSRMVMKPMLEKKLKSP